MTDLHEIHRRCGPALLRKARRVLQSEADAQDVVQGLLVDLWRKGRLTGDLPYLYRAVTHRCLNHIRDATNRRRFLEAHDDALRWPTAVPIDGRAVDRDLLFKLADRLDRQRWEVLVYRHFDDMALDEIAEVTGRSRKTIARWLARAQAEAGALAREGT